MLIAIDGPAGSGKSAAARRLAARLRFLHLDTGALYRTFTLLAQEEGAPLDDEAALAALVDPSRIAVEAGPEGQQIVHLDGRDVTHAIRSPEVTRAVRALASKGKVRERVTALARALGGRTDCVSDGRDTTTVIFPGADLKVYIDAAPEERARRRLLDLEARGIETDREAVLEEILDRDRSDREREVGPLRVADDAVVIDTTSISLDEVVDRLADLVEARR